MSDPYHKNIVLIKRVLLNKGITYKTLSDKTNISISTIKRIFSGKRHMTLFEQDKILWALNINEIELTEKNLSHSHIELIRLIKQLNNDEAALLVKILKSSQYKES